jgi:hypothetical protein
LQLDPTFSERDFGAGSFLDFIQKLRKAGLVEMRRTERGYLVEAPEAEAVPEAPAEPVEVPVEAEPAAEAPVLEAQPVSSAPPVIPAASLEDSLAVLRLALPGHFEKAPNRPVYLRQIRQILRAAGSAIDERSGFRGLLDILHQAQREGWVRLHRDRKGVWRIFPTAASAPAPAATLTPAGEAPQELESEPLPVETDVHWEATEPAEEIVEPAEPPVPPVVEEGAPVEAPPQRKPRKPRATKAGTKSGARKAPPRRKAKEPVES